MFAFLRKTIHQHSKKGHPIYRVIFWVITLFSLAPLLLLWFNNGYEKNNFLAFYTSFWVSVGIAVGLFTAALIYVDFVIRRSVLLSLYGIALLAATLLDVSYFSTIHSELFSSQPHYLAYVWSLNTFYYIFCITAVTVVALKVKAKNLRIPQNGRKIIKIAMLGAFVTVATILYLTNFTSIPSSSSNFLIIVFNTISLLFALIWGAILMRSITMRYPSVFLKYFALSTIPISIATVFMLASNSNFDYCFNTAHYLKFVAYVIPFVGIIINYIESLKNEQKIILKLDNEIKEKQKLTNFLLERENLLANAEKISKLGSWVLDLSSETYTWSNQLYEIYGISDQTLSPTTSLLKQIISPEHLNKVEKELKTAINNKTNFAVEYQVIQPNKTKRYVLNQGYFSNIENKLIGTVQDITELKEATLKLRKNETLLREGEAVAHNGSWEWHSNNDIIFWSDEMFNIHGFLPHSTFATIHSYSKLVHPDDVKLLRIAFKRALKNKSTFNISYRIVRPNGEIRNVDTTGNFKVGETDSEYSVLGNTQDVTVLKETERMLEEKIKELNTSNKDLEQFAYVASHDLQEPLRKIRAFGDRLYGKFSADIPDEGKDYISRMQNAAERMQVLIDDLLAFSRVTRQARIFVPLSLDSVIKQAIQDLEYAVEKTKAKISVNVQDVTEGIAPQLVQVFQNIISNSIKFTEAGTIPQIFIKSTVLLGSNLPISGAAANQQYCMIEITDNGIGFDESYAGKIFDLFQRLHTRSEYKGTGIGLAICKKIVDSHNGFIFAKSNVGQGASFFVILPKTQAT